MAESAVLAESTAGPAGAAVSAAVVGDLRSKGTTGVLRMTKTLGAAFGVVKARRKASRAALDRPGALPYGRGRKSIRRKSMPMRPSGRKNDQLRAVSLEPGFAKHAEGSCLIRFGDTHVLCTASVDEKVPPFLRNSGSGWVTAEYGMLPRSTHTRTDREAAKGKQSGRTQEIQRLIGRSLRSVLDAKALGERQIKIDCDVLQADGGTRTASITGAWVALHQALTKLVAAKTIPPCRCATMSRRFPAASPTAAPCSISITSKTRPARSTRISC